MKLDIWLKKFQAMYKCAVWLLLSAYSEIWEERNDLKLMKLLIKREAERKNLENSQPTHILKNQKACLRKNMKGVAKLVQMGHLNQS